MIIGKLSLEEMEKVIEKINKKEHPIEFYHGTDLNKKITVIPFYDIVKVYHNDVVIFAGKGKYKTTALEIYNNIKPKENK